MPITREDVTATTECSTCCEEKGSHCVDVNNKTRNSNHQERMNLYWKENKGRIHDETD